MKSLAVVVIAGLVASGAYVCDCRAPTAPDDAGFAVKFPGKPKETKASPGTKLGKLKVVTATYADAAANVFMASHTEFPEGTGKPENLAAILDGVRDGLKGSDGTALAEDEVEFGREKLPGRELTVRKDEQYVRVLAVVRGDRLYQVGVVGTKEFTRSKEADAFLKSFELKK